MSRARGDLRRGLVAAVVGALLWGVAPTQAASETQAPDAPLPFVLPVPARDVTDTETSLAGASREVVVMTSGRGGPHITKLRAGTAADAARLTDHLDRLPGVTAAANQVYRVPVSSSDAGDAGDHPLAASAVAGTPGANPGPRIDDEQYGPDQWGLDLVGAEGAWQVTRAKGVTVAVVDSGVDASHPDLVGRVLPQVDVAPGPTVDVAGHGTQVAGIIAASLDGAGVVGLANQASVLPIRVFDAQGVGDTASVARGVTAAMGRGVQVVNLSLGGPGNDPVLARAIATAVGRGITVVASAGNDHERGNPVTYPANHPDVIGVGSVTPDAERSDFSNTGRYVDLAAPGEHIRTTTLGGSLVWASGTSMAAPFVSAAAALVRAANPALSGPAVANVLFVTAGDDPAGDGKDTSFGYGLVRADAATARAAALPGGARGPLIAVRVAATRGGYGDRLTVDVNPDKSDIRSYDATVQRRAANGSWRPVRRLRTQGSAERLSLTLPPGLYRVVVPATRGYAYAASSPVTLTEPTVQVRATAGRKGTLRVDVNPDRGKRAWTFKVQKRRPGGRWSTMRSYRTKGAAETRSIRLKAGTYRVVVLGDAGFAGSVSAPVTLVR